MNVCTQNTGDTVHMRKNAATMGEAKSPFLKRSPRLPLCTVQSHFEVVKLPQIDIIYLHGLVQHYAELPTQVLQEEQHCQLNAWSLVEWSSPGAAQCRLPSVGKEHMGQPQGAVTRECQLHGEQVQFHEVQETEQGRGEKK